MTRAGWIVDNLHMLEPMIQMAIPEKAAHRRQGHNFMDRATANDKAWWYAYAQELCERDLSY